MKNFFFKQTDGDTCGPIAFLNYLKFVGRKVKRNRDLPLIKKTIGWEKNVGSQTYLYKDGLRVWGIAPIEKEQISIRTLDKILQKKPVILTYAFRWKNEIKVHTVMAYGKKKDKYLVTNWFVRTTFSVISKIEMAKTLSISKRILFSSSKYPQAIYSNE